VTELSADNDEACRAVQRFLPDQNIEQLFTQKKRVQLAWDTHAPGDCVGVLLWSTPVLKPYTEIETIEIDSDYKGRGVSTNLIDAVLNQSKSLKRRFVRVCLDPDNGPLHWLYERCGFRDQQRLMHLRKSFAVES
jgi:ribosomal protein S18 acetylase RimI-like enzyme